MGPQQPACIPAAAGLLLWARRAGDIGRLLQHGGGQWHVVSVRRPLNIQTCLLKGVGYSSARNGGVTAGSSANAIDQ